MQQLLGIAIVLGAVFGGFTLMGGTFTSIFHPIELLIIGGAALGLSADDYQQYLLAESAEEMLSFDEVLQEAVGAEHHTPGPEDAYMVRRSLEQALAGLNEKEQRVIQMIYEFELSYKEIAAVLDLSDARVCQLNKSALAKMNTALRRD